MVPNKDPGRVRTSQRCAPINGKQYVLTPTLYNILFDDSTDGQDNVIGTKTSEN